METLTYNASSTPSTASTGEQQYREQQRNTRHEQRQM
jgi:hypothetical protein